ncbi:uncharacterized protein [Spinacia oleracea]|uniref:DUF4283 domain-containing protein n=1 Tax=Spinacia oleracea TaxID=3562 RepID=A0ABM3QPV1_SPIOL|nr:uncharacterized protein LOC130461340 [Spinacia oleracea]
MQENEIDKLTDVWLASIVLYVVGDAPTIASVKRFIDATWSNVGTPNVFLHDEGYFLVQFDSIADRDLVLSGGPYTFFSKPVIVKPWAANFNFYEEVLRVIPLWVKLPNLPLNCWSSQSLSRIGSLLGVPICADDCTTRQQRISFARLLVEMDVTDTLPDHVWIVDTNGREFKQLVLYDWKPAYCHKCKMPGHNCALAVKRRVEPQQKDTRVKKIWVPKKHQGWKVATKKSRNKGAPVSTTNHFGALDEEDTEEEEGTHIVENIEDDEDIPPPPNIQ